MPQLTARDYHQLLAVEVARLGSVSDDHLSYPIPHIEGWTVASVIGHTGWVARYVTEILTSSPDSPPRRGDIPEPPVGPDVRDWFIEAASELKAELETTDPAALRPSFAGPQPASWWLRRAAHETTMHRWDVESAVGTPQAIDQAQAIDGINEVLEVFAPIRLQFGVFAGSGETIHLHGTDTEEGLGEWLITMGPESLEWTTGHAKGDVAARASVSDLLLMLWSRIPPSRLEVFGDAQILNRWQEAATF